MTKGGFFIFSGIQSNNKFYFTLLLGDYYYYCCCLDGVGGDLSISDYILLALGNLLITTYYLTSKDDFLSG